MMTVEYLNDGRFILGFFIGEGWKFKTIEPLAELDGLCYVSNEGQADG